MLTIVGAGPGSPEYLLPIAQQAIKEAELIIGAKRLVAKLVNGNCERVYLKEINYNPKKVLALAKTKKTVLLVSGDPGLFSIAKKITNLTKEVNIIPGISPIQLFFACLHKSWEQVTFISLHGLRSLTALNNIKPKQNYLIFLDSTKGLDIVGNYLAAKISSKHVYLGLDLGLPTEQVIKTTMEELSKLKIKKSQLALLYIEGAGNDAI